MAKLSKVDLKKSEVKVEFDLEKIFGQPVKNEVIRETFFQLAYDKLLERLDQGKDVSGQAMKKYSKEYKESLAYDVFGKDGTVNLRLSGDMLESLQIKTDNSKKIVAAFSKEESPKAYGHMTGMKDHPTIKNGVKREFFGWQDKELSAIARELRPELNEESSLTDTQILTVLNRLTSG